MVCVQVVAEDNAIAFAAAQGNFELNTMLRVIISIFLQLRHESLADASETARELHRGENPTWRASTRTSTGR